MPHAKVRAEAKRLAGLLRAAPIAVAHTGAGLSTAAGENMCICAFVVVLFVFAVDVAASTALTG